MHKHEVLNHEPHLRTKISRQRGQCYIKVYSRFQSHLLGDQIKDIGNEDVCINIKI